MQRLKELIVILINVIEIAQVSAKTLSLRISLYKRLDSNKWMTTKKFVQISMSGIVRSSGNQIRKKLNI